VRHGIAEARRYVWDLRSQVLDENDLPAALIDTARRLTTDASVSAKVEVSGTFRALSPLIEGNILRIAQEAINNAVRHAQARNILVNLKFDANRVQLIVRDDGCGFNYQESMSGAAKHFGLVGMQERAGLLGGDIRIDGQEGKGTTVLLRIPLAPAQAGDVKIL